MHSLRTNGTRFVKSLVALFVFAAFTSLSATSHANAQTTFEQLEKLDFKTKTITRAQLAKIPLDELRLLRGIVFGRHGRVFKDRDIRDYLNNQPWYKPDPNFQNASLNKTERANLDVIREAEARKHENIQPGDMRFYQTRQVTLKELGEHTGAEWKILSAEVEALHGKRFMNDAWLQEYFEDRYWYEPRDDYDPKKLTPVERQNLNAIAQAQKRQRNLQVSPGDMELFQNTLLTEDKLNGLNLFELRVMRNEVYARHGKVFNTMWLAAYFNNQSWYEPESEKQFELSTTEKANVETILRVENRLHEDLNRKPITVKTLAGLYREDARRVRNEIYARHGMTFKDADLQNYFSSLAWYKPNVEYSDKLLTEIERRNAATILAYERRAKTQDDLIEA